MKHPYTYIQPNREMHRGFIQIPKRVGQIEAWFKALCKLHGDLPPYKTVLASPAAIQFVFEHGNILIDRSQKHV